MHLGVAAADKRANSSFSHPEPPRSFLICCVTVESEDLDLLNNNGFSCSSTLGGVFVSE